MELTRLPRAIQGVWMAMACGCVLVGTPVLGAGKEAPVRPEAMVVVPHAPLSWAGMDLKGPEYSGNGAGAGRRLAAGCGGAADDPRRARLDRGLGPART